MYPSSVFSEALAHLGRQRKRTAAVGADMDDGVTTVDTEFISPEDPPDVRDRSAADPFRPDPNLNFVLEPKYLVVLGLDAPSRIVPPVAQESEAPAEPGFGKLSPAKYRREVDAPTGIRIDPSYTKALDMLDMFH